MRSFIAMIWWYSTPESGNHHQRLSCDQYQMKRASQSRAIRSSIVVIACPTGST